MTDELRPYPEYKESGVPWLGKVPAHWEMLRAKYIFREVDDRSPTGAETHLSMSQQHGLIASSKLDDGRLRSESYVGGKRCKTNDLVLNRLKAHLGVFAHGPQDGVVSPDYSVFRLGREGEVRYFAAVLRAPACVAEIRRATKGIVEGFWRLYTDDFYKLVLPVPPVEEQRPLLAWIDRLDSSFAEGLDRERELISIGA